MTQIFACFLCAQYEHVKDLWPQSYHPATVPEELAPLGPPQERNMLYYLFAALADASAARDSWGSSFGGVVVEPVSGRVLCCASNVAAELHRQASTRAAATGLHRSETNEDGISVSSHSIVRNGSRQVVAASGPWASLHPLHTPTMLCVRGVGWQHQSFRSSAVKLSLLAADGLSSQGTDASDASFVAPTSKRQREVPDFSSIEEGNGCPSSGDDDLLSRCPWIVSPSADVVSNIGCVPWKSFSGYAVDEPGISGLAPVVEQHRLEDPYLCTGLDLYLTHEPSAM